MANDLLRAALYYAKKLQWRVFPCHSIGANGICTCADPNCQNAGKHPHYRVGSIEDGVNAATVEEKKIKEWWEIWPDANIGIACGVKSGIVVLDVDPRNGGDESLSMLEEEHGKLPTTVESMTGGGGRHYVFGTPGYGVRCNKNKLGGGLDIKADGGYIIAPPSNHKSGHKYEWEVSSKPTVIPLAPLPEWLLKQLETPTGGNGHKPAGDVPETIREGERDNTLISIAGTMRRRGMTVDEILIALTEVNKRCDPPLATEDLDRIAKSVSRYEPAQPQFPGKPEIERREPVNALNGILQFTDLLSHLEGRSIPTYITPIDEATGGLERQTLSILAARPSMGKSTLAWQIARNVASSGLIVYFFSLEMSVVSLWAKAICGLAGVRWRDVRSQKINDYQMDRVMEEAAKMMEKYNDALLVDECVNTTQTIWDNVNIHRPDLVIIDHLRLVADQHENEVQRLGMISKRFKDMAKAYNCHVLCLAQLNRGVESRDNKRPQLADLRESGHIEENADSVFVLYRDDYYEPSPGMPTLSETEFIIRKFRDDIGNQLVKLNFDLQHQWFGKTNELNG